MKVIFLDIDGVLNSVRTARAYEGFGSARHVNHCEDPLLDPVAVKLLQRLVARTGAKIVLSSAWRIGMEVSAFVRSLEHYYGWSDAPIIDKTSYLHAKRGTEIAKWLENHPEVTGYVIIDDSSDMLPNQMKRLVQTRFNIGLCHDHIEMAGEILGMAKSKIMVVSA